MLTLHSNNKNILKWSGIQGTSLNCSSWLGWISFILLLAFNVWLWAACWIASMQSSIGLLKPISAANEHGAGCVMSTWWVFIFLLMHHQPIDGDSRRSGFLRLLLLSPKVWTLCSPLSFSPTPSSPSRRSLSPSPSLVLSLVPKPPGRRRVGRGAAGQRAVGGFRSRLKEGVRGTAEPVCLNA